MKKVILLLVLTFLLCSCAAETKDVSQTADSAVLSENSYVITDADVNYSLDVIESKEDAPKIYMTYAGRGQYVSPEHEQFVRELFTTRDWIDDTAECISNYTIAIDGVLFDYSVDCGTINCDGKSKRLNESEKIEFNAILTEMFG